MRASGERPTPQLLCFLRIPYVLHAFLPAGHPRAPARTSARTVRTSAAMSPKSYKLQTFLHTHCAALVRASGERPTPQLLCFLRIPYVLHAFLPAGHPRTTASTSARTVRTSAAMSPEVYKLQAFLHTHQFAPVRASFQLESWPLALSQQARTTRRAHTARVPVKHRSPSPLLVR